jgi:outer membrane biosynthesis protein TonB
MFDISTNIRADIRASSIPADGQRKDRMRSGLIGSSALHVLAALLVVFILPLLTLAPPRQEQIVAINLVRLGEKTTAPWAAKIAPLPQEKARIAANEPPAQAVPAPQTPPPEAVTQQRNKAGSTAQRSAASAQEQKPEIPMPLNRSDRDAFSAVKPGEQPSPATDLGERLKMLARLRQPAPPVPANPRQQNGSGYSDATAASSQAEHARDAAYGVKDFIRAQVERHWYTNGDTAKAGDWVVRIHIVLNPSGQVDKAEIVDDPRFSTDRNYRDFAISARNAVLLSSPLIVPEGDYDIARDVVVDFNARRDLQ